MPIEDKNPEIRIDKIPVRGGIGALLVIVLLISGMLVQLPGLRWPVLSGVLGGAALGIGLIFWRRRGGF